MLVKLVGTMFDFDPLFDILPENERQPSKIAHYDNYEAVTGVLDCDTVHLICCLSCSTG